MGSQERSLAQVEDLAELKKRYGVFSCEKLLRWAQLVVGPHREAMEALLRERGQGAPGPDPEGGQARPPLP